MSAERSHMFQVCFMVVLVWFARVVCDEDIDEDDYNISEGMEFTNSIRAQPKQFKIYWNVPTVMCMKYDLDFTKIIAEFKIIQNDSDKFRGEKFVILYDPGYFPALLENSTSKSLFYRNGGIPQAGNLSLHLKLFHKHMNELVSEDFKGTGVIDFESWRPIFRQNFGALAPYKQAAIDYERNLHPFWPASEIQKEAVKQWEKAGRMFMEQTLLAAQNLRRNASWGYYAYPYCFNMNPSSRVADCGQQVRKENNQLHWLWSVSDVFLPSVYVQENSLTSSDRLRLVQGRVKEATRLTKWNSHANVLPYIRYVYTDTRAFLTEHDLYVSLKAIKTGFSNGAVFWGSSSDLNTKEKCLQHYTYIQNILGPISEGFVTNN